MRKHIAFSEWTNDTQCSWRLMTELSTSLQITPAPPSNLRLSLGCETGTGETVNKCHLIVKVEFSKNLPAKNNAK